METKRQLGYERVLTPEQITQQVADMQTRLDTCAQSGQAYCVKWSDVKSIIATIKTLQEQLVEAHDFNNDVVEREAAVCPEDVGFDEYIRSLQSQLAAMTQERDDLPSQLEQLRAENKQHELRIADLERRLRIPSGHFPCAQCGGPHDFDTSVPSVVWNAVIRARNLPDYLCTTCIVREFVRAGQGFTAELWSEEFNGAPIEVVVNGQNAKDASLVQEENNALRHRLSEMEKELSGSAEAIVNEAGKVGQLINLASASAVGDFRSRAIQLCKDKAANYKALADNSLPNDQTAARLAAASTALDRFAAELEKL